MLIRAREYKTNLLNSAEHKILNAHKYKKIIKKNKHFPGSDKPRMLLFLHINFKRQAIVGILTFMSWNSFVCSAELSMKFCL